MNNPDSPGFLIPDAEELKTLANMPMPFGKYKGVLLIDLPEPYVVWFKRQGFPGGKLGRLLETLYEIKVNGLEKLIRPLRSNSSS
ncbi:MAG: DUF3820 family protein [Deltaproteobacteria bacterium]|nr:DUF3820 family protein [Deltaproteobacteria bacterium]MBN2672433.1 DUF3820 family protein [Deltaproteobacteria bacterium]